MANNTIGIVGSAGDLGKRLTVQACANFASVTVVDRPGRALDLSTGVMPGITAFDMLQPPTIMASPQDVFDAAEIIHWCAPLSALEVVDIIRDDQLLVLHSSVMATSQTAREDLLRDTHGIRGDVAIVHCSMNDVGTVSVAEENSCNPRVIDHIEALGLSVKMRTIKEHDAVAALTQGLAAVLKHVVVPRLQALEVNGDLTPSGQRLIDGITSTAAVWTDETYQTIRRNPELVALLGSILDEIQGVEGE